MDFGVVCGGNPSASEKEGQTAGLCLCQNTSGLVSPPHPHLHLSEDVSSSVLIPLHTLSQIWVFGSCQEATVRASNEIFPLREHFFSAFKNDSSWLFILFTLNPGFV